MNNYIQEIDTQIQKKSLLNHVFYQAWSAGKLTKECLKDYAINYYAHVKAFPTYLSGVHFHTEDMKTRQLILQNLVEEEAGYPNHPDMWKDFALRLGATNEEVDQNTPIASIQNLISTFKDICVNEETANGIASLYAYESQIPSICESKIDGLKKYYNMSSPADWRYFSVHIAADKEHSAVERELLNKYVTASNEKSVKHSVQRTLDALWKFLDEMCDRHGICQTCQAAI